VSERRKQCAAAYVQMSETCPVSDVRKDRGKEALAGNSGGIGRKTVSEARKCIAEAKGASEKRGKARSGKRTQERVRAESDSVFGAKKRGGKRVQPNVG